MAASMLALDYHVEAEVDPVLDVGAFALAPAPAPALALVLVLVFVLVFVLVLVFLLVLGAVLELRYAEKE